MDCDHLVVLIGNDRTVYNVLRQKYCARVHVFSEKRVPHTRFSFGCRFVRTKNIAPDILPFYLESLAASEKDSVPVITADAAHKRLLDSFSQEIDSTYIIIDAEELLRE